MTLPSYEKLGVFYLGRELDPESQQLREPLLYDSRDLTTHAVCIGMTGSGKTGLCISLLEEAAIDGIPALVIDPKGDIGNLALTFPELRGADFEPWVDPGEAERKGLTVAAHAAATAENWRKGLAEWDQDGARIGRLRAAAEIAIYTPGSSSGRPLSVLRSFAAPDAALAADATAMRERVGGAVAGLLGLLGIDADPVQSREHILLSAILDHAWRNAGSPDLAALIQAVLKPPFDKVGVFDVETFMSAKDRGALALRINALLAAPGFSAWLEGEPLDIQRLLFTPAGGPRIAIVSIAHLNDAERMFVVALVANELVAWMRRQGGTSSLRAVFYMDEVTGYLPPVAVPPSKPPLLTLMKQARAFGVGVVLATQNPVDLDYKGLSNAGTWFIGRLQTERDQARVIEGLLATDAAAGMDRSTLERLMSNLGQRTFLMRNVHDDEPALFRTRWALCYLRGPLTLQEIARLTGTPGPGAAPSVATAPPATPAAHPRTTGTGQRPIVAAGVVERFLEAGATEAPVIYGPRFGAQVRAHFVDGKAGLDAWESWYYLAPLTEAGPDWPEAEVLRDRKPAFVDSPTEGARFIEPPSAALAFRSYRDWARDLEEHVYRNETLTVFHCPLLGVSAAPGGTEGEFRAHIALALREKRDAAVEGLRERYQKKLRALGDRRRRAEQKLEREKTQAAQQTTSSVLDVGGSLLGVLFGSRRSSAARKASAAARSVGRASKERGDVRHAEADLEALGEQLAALEAELDSEISRLSAELEPAAVPIERREVRPRKADLSVEEPSLVWRP
jgi:hypothetical protein